MSYITQDEKAKIAPVIKKILKSYGLKGTLSIRHNSTICLTITAGSIDFFASANRMNLEFANRRGDDVRVVKDHLSVNPYHFQTHFDGVAVDFLMEAFAALRGEGWYNNTDIQSDYFDVKHYVDINIGKWNKAYVHTTV